MAIPMESSPIPCARGRCQWQLRGARPDKPRRQRSVVAPSGRGLLKQPFDFVSTLKNRHLTTARTPLLWLMAHLQEMREERRQTPKEFASFGASYRFDLLGQ